MFKTSSDIETGGRMESLRGKEWNRNENLAAMMQKSTARFAVEV